MQLASKPIADSTILTMPAVKIRRMVSVRDGLPAMHPVVYFAPQANQPIQHLLTPLKGTVSQMRNDVTRANDDLRHTFASWFMMNGGDHYELAKILGHSNIKTTERYAKLAKKHIARS